MGEVTSYKLQVFGGRFQGIGVVSFLGNFL